MQKLISIWKNKNKNGKIYYSGKLGEVNIIGFENVKENEKQPDIVFYVAEEKKNAQKNEKTVQKSEKASTNVFEEFGEQVSIDDYLK